MMTGGAGGVCDLAGTGVRIGCGRCRLPHHVVQVEDRWPDNRLAPSSGQACGQVRASDRNGGRNLEGSGFIVMVGSTGGFVIVRSAGTATDNRHRHHPLYIGGWRLAVTPTWR
ncbi:hypothetical protein DRH27_05600 [Candidatus Falkowbacteria bacterium]|nr:MAG: hypothetical protein DRH27_05600 [Candidatus Falkowbacteria bacterium]